jgi:predicted LPLAT superfamily acyltransferase
MVIRNSQMVAKLQDLILMMCLCIMLGQGVCAEAWATTIYSYNLVYTDSAETIPEKYRAKVKTHEQPDSVSKTPSMMQSMQQKVREQAKNYGWNMPSFHVAMDGLTPAQSKIVTYAGAAAVVLLLMMYLSKSQLMRMLGLCLLMVIGIGAPVLIYVSESGPMDVMKKKAVSSGQVQQDRLQQAPQ